MVLIILAYLTVYSWFLHFTLTVSTEMNRCTECHGNDKAAVMTHFIYVESKT